LCDISGFSFFRHRIHNFVCVTPRTIGKTFMEQQTLGRPGIFAD
jgi:hypothetical protein